MTQQRNTLPVHFQVSYWALVGLTLVGTAYIAHAVTGSWLHTIGAPMAAELMAVGLTSYGETKRGAWKAAIFAVVTALCGASAVLQIAAMFEPATDHAAVRYMLATLPSAGLWVITAVRFKEAGDETRNAAEDLRAEAATLRNALRVAQADLATANATVAEAARHAENAARERQGLQRDLDDAERAARSAEAALVTMRADRDAQAMRAAEFAGELRAANKPQQPAIAPGIPATAAIAGFAGSPATRMHRVAALAGAAKTQEEIAGELRVSLRTVQNEMRAAREAGLI